MEKRNLLFVTIALFYLMFNIQTVKAQWTTQTSGTTNDLNSIYDQEIQDLIINSKNII